MLCQALNHISTIKAFAQYSVKNQHHLAHLVFQGKIYDSEIVVTIQNVEVFYHLLVGDVALAEAGSLVEDGESVSHTSVSLFCNDGKCLLLILDAFLFCYHLQMVDGVRHGHALEVVNLTSAENGRQNLVLFGSGKDKDYMRRWFFQRFEEGVESCGTQHVDLVDDKHFVFSYLWRNAGLLHQGLDLVNTVVAGSIQLKDIEGTLFVERATALAFVACLTVFVRVLAVDCLGKNSGTSSLSHTSRTAEKIGMSQLAALYCIFQSGGQSSLSNYRVKGHWTVLSCRNYIFFHYFFLIDDAKKYYLCKQIHNYVDFHEYKMVNIVRN